MLIRCEIRLFVRLMVYTLPFSFILHINISLFVNRWIVVGNISQFHLRRIITKRTDVANTDTLLRKWTNDLLLLFLLIHRFPQDLCTLNSAYYKFTSVYFNLHISSITKSVATVFFSPTVLRPYKVMANILTFCQTMKAFYLKCTQTNRYLIRVIGSN